MKGKGKRRRNPQERRRPRLKEEKGKGRKGELEQMTNTQKHRKEGRSLTNRKADTLTKTLVKMMSLKQVLKKPKSQGIRQKLNMKLMMNKDLTF